MSPSEKCAARQARTIRYGDERARVAVARTPAGAPQQGRATGTRRPVAAHRAAASTHRPNGRRWRVPFDFHRLRA
ncbi:hypothetical protein DF150_31250 [Burkholderia cenocepacia]|nr:hypothetical protein C6T64_29905 [Burkholderia cenocepacia]RQU27306.1 hypothetical protein DF150_31250 [Burkholderia cenocepacia]